MNIKLKNNSVQSPPTTLLCRLLTIHHNSGMVSEFGIFWAYTSLDFSGFWDFEPTNMQKKTLEMPEVSVCPQADSRRLCRNSPSEKTPPYRQWAKPCSFFLFNHLSNHGY